MKKIPVNCPCCDAKLKVSKLVCDSWEQCTHLGGIRPFAESGQLTQADIHAEIGETVAELTAQGRIRPVVDSVFALAEAGKAHARMEEGEHKGKWRGRTPGNKLVFFADPRDWAGKIARVRITQRRNCFLICWMRTR